MLFWCRQPNATHSHLHAVRGRLPSSSYFYFRGWLVLSAMMVQVVSFGIFWEIPSGNVPVFSAIWFGNGYMFASAHEVLLDKGVDMSVVWSRQFGPDSSWPGCGCVCRCATTGAWSDSAVCRAGAAVAILRWSSTSRLWCRGRFPWFSLLGRPSRLRSCSMFPGGRCPCCAGRACSARCARQVPMVQILQKFVLMPQVQFQRLWTSLSCAATRESVDLSVATETCTHSCICAWLAAMRGSLLQFCSIFRPPSI